MFSVDISYDQPWFDHIRLLRSREEKALRSYFKALEADVSQLVLEDPDIYETELTTGLVRSLKGVDSVAKRDLDSRLEASGLGVRITARELRGRPATSGELLDFVIEVKISTPSTVWLHRALLVEGKRLYPACDAFTAESRFKELNRPESQPGGQRRVRSAVQTKTMMEVHCRAGAFFLYCPEKVGRDCVGIRVLFPETVCLLPRQPMLRQVYGDTLPLPEFMIEHVFTGRRGVDFDKAGGITSMLRGEPGGPVAARYHWSMDIMLPNGRGPL